MATTFWQYLFLSGREGDCFKNSKKTKMEQIKAKEGGSNKIL
jgi:hypothetical protein